MPLIQWSDQLSLGIDSIDKQHKVLVNLINELNDAISEGKADQVLSKIFDGLGVYVVKHFDYEEKLLAKYAYTEEDAHKREHGELNRQVQDLRKKLEDGDFMLNIEVMIFLKDWLTHHILQTDKAYAPFLIAKGVT